jgi:histidine triad (HIT) family protein
MVGHTARFMQGCTFCAVVSGSLPADVVVDTTECLAFLDRAPLFKGHVLIVPKVHVVTLLDLPAHLVSPLFSAAQAVAAAVVKSLAADGSFVAINNEVSQSVPHLHVHVVPRRRKDGLRGFFWPRTRYVDDDERADYAARLREALTFS